MVCKLVQLLCCGRFGRRCGCAGCRCGSGGHGRRVCRVTRGSIVHRPGADPKQDCNDYSASDEWSMVRIANGAGRVRFGRTMQGIMCHLSLPLDSGCSNNIERQTGVPGSETRTTGTSRSGRARSACKHHASWRTISRSSGFSQLARCCSRDRSILVSGTPGNLRRCRGTGASKCQTHTEPSAPRIGDATLRRKSAFQAGRL
jgi:hypothetical protein